MATNATSNQFEALGLDVGNGHIKSVFRGQNAIIPSLIHQVYDADYEYGANSQGCLLEYVSGDRIDLTNTRWLVGSPAFVEFPDSCSRIVDDRNNKVSYCLQALCGVLSAYSQLPQKLNLAICASVHDSLTFGDDIKGSLNGCHTVRINGQTVTLTLKTLVTDEGTGAVIHAVRTGLMTRDSKALVLDIGCGTCIATAFNGSSLIRQSRYIHSQGSNRLLQLIADHPTTRRELGGISGDRRLIDVGIQNGSFQYGKMFGFYEAYAQLLPDWVLSTLAPCMKKSAPWLPDCNHLFAIGGGASLPGIDRILGKKGIKVLPNNQLANALGLAAIAQSKLGA